MNRTTIAIVATECRHAAESKATLNEQIEASFDVARNHWITTNEDERFQGAVAAIYELSDDETKERIKSELDSLKTLSAMLSGVPINFDRFTELSKAYEPIGLMKRWKPSPNI